ncbi:MAG TPA: hypothetical protein DCL78_11705, partial [Gammaproteobacteria bacterium]|nr:hypothetical protein [Gammaproteobacteria bacterium]
MDEARNIKTILYPLARDVRNLHTFVANINNILQAEPDRFALAAPPGLASLRNTLRSLAKSTKAMQEVNEIQFNRANTFLLEITKTSKSSGQLWVALARFFSGGAFWRIQNKIKAYSNLLNFRAKMQTEALKKEKENVEQLAKQTKHQKALLNIVEKIGKLRE